MRLALYQPDIPQNTGAILRLAACFGAPLDIIEPCSFPLDDRRLRRVAMDYAPHAEITRHRSWDAFQATLPGQRRILLTTRASTAYTDFRFISSDILLLGRESAGVPEAVHAAADAAITIPLTPGARSLNVGMAAAIVLSEARRQVSPLDCHAAASVLPATI